MSPNVLARIVGRNQDGKQQAREVLVLKGGVGGSEGQTRKKMRTLDAGEKRLGSIQIFLQDRCISSRHNLSVPLCKA